jgi:iron complex outermembrane receptor protein
MHFKLFPVFLVALTSNVFSFDLLTEGTESEQPSLPPIKGISNLNQIESDMPSAFSEVGYDLLEKLGIYKTEEAMRLIPGMVVASSTDYNPFIQYHGTNAVKQRMGIRFNGHDYTIGQIHKNSWRQFNFSDIKRISVSRSPGGANFGDRSFMAQMNLDTFTPLDLEGASLKYITGSRQTHIINGAASDRITRDLLFSVTVSLQKTDGFDYEPDGVTKRWDYTDSKQINGKLFYDKDQHKFSLYVGLIDGEHGSSFASGAGDNQPINNDPNDKFSSAKLDLFFDYEFDQIDKVFRLSMGNQKFNSEQDWQICNPAYFYIESLARLSDINPDLSYAVAFDNPYDQSQLTQEENSLINEYKSERQSLGQAAFHKSCYEISQRPRTERLNLDASYEMEITSGFRTIFGVNSYRETFASEIFLGGEVENYGYNLYSQSEYKQKHYTINFGISSESGKTFSAVTAVKGSFNWHFNEHNTLRFAYSEGYRTPDALESSRDWRYKGKAINENPFNRYQLEYFYKNKISTTLSSEKIKSYEISYLTNFDNMQIDLKIFQDDLEDLMNDTVAVFQHHIDNSSSNRIQGFETEMTFDLNPVQLGIIYAYMDYSTNAKSEALLDPKHTGSVYGVSELSEANTVAVAFYGNSDIAGEYYGRTDITYTFDWELSDSALSLQTRYSYYLNDAFAVDVIDYSISKSYIQNKNEIYVMFKLDF